MEKSISLNNYLKVYFQALVAGRVSGKVKLNISTPEKAKQSYKEFVANGKSCCVSEVFKRYISVLNNNESDVYRLNTVDKFVEFFSDPDVLRIIDDKDSSVLGKCIPEVNIILPKGAGYVTSRALKAAKEYFEMAAAMVPEFDPNIYWISDESEVGEKIAEIKRSMKDDSHINFFWVCRHNIGNAPVMLMQGTVYDSEKEALSWSAREANHVKSIYAAATKTRYYDGRPCSYDYWVSNENVRFHTAEYE